ncbi:MAG TPA: CatB-related O-acetyltransferase [Pyrinomonadaceae bacterium]|jgi:acetyltransferase-like isoleucine patch superfamily enzyme|nr:CatB-related O-acetyltransferase [Pyrinomonadaceae bacterium]
MSENPLYSSYNIGRWTYGRPEIYDGDEGGPLTIGSFCSIASGVKIVLGGEHHLNRVTTYPFNILFPDAESYTGHPHSKGAVTIGNDVWIGQDASIFSGVRVGNGAVIAARSVVRRNVAPYSIVGGNPALHLAYRFDGATISALQEIAWWDWPLDQIKEAWPLLLASDLKAFIATYGGINARESERLS